MGRRMRARAAAAAATGGERLTTLTEAGFDTTIRAIHTKDQEKVYQIFTLAEDAMERTGHTVDASKAVTAIPQASDQLDIRSLVVWAEKIGRRDKAAVNQLLAIHATAKARLGK